jgi:RNA polymerase sigma-70 factor (ECF subfamily)
MNSGDDASWTGFGPVSPDATSWSLLERVKRGESDSRNRLCRLYGRLVWRIYLGKVPRQDRMDVWQEVFHTVFQKINEFQKTEIDGPAFRSWLSAISHNKVGDYLRRGRRNGLSVSNSAIDGMSWIDGNRFDDGGTELTDERTEPVRGAFEEAASSFEPLTVDAVRQVVFFGRPVKDVAEALEMSTGAVHVAKSRVLARLRAILNDLGESLGSLADPVHASAESKHGGVTS